jgi:DNA-binding CsgD family transcriptional regulator
MPGGDGLSGRRSATLEAPPDELLGALWTAEQRGLRGEPVEALQDLARLGGYLSELRVGRVAALCAVAESAVLLAAWGADRDVARQLCDAALAATEDASARGRVLLSRARVGVGRARREDYTAALTECGAAGDVRGQALALAGLSCPRPNDPDSIAAEYHVRVARDAIRLARESGDPEAIAACAGTLAAGESYLGLESALARWQHAAEEMPAATSIHAAEAISVNYANWVLAATGRGEYATARRALHEGRALARGIAWRRTFGALETLIYWRTGSFDDAVVAAHAVTTRGPAVGPAVRASAMATVISSAISFERERRPNISGLAEAVAQVSQESDLLAAVAQAVQARIRAIRREPDPHRGLVTALSAAVRRKRRFGWEDLAITLSEIAPSKARQVLPTVEGLWSPGRRSDAARKYADGLLEGVAGYPLLLAAADAFLALPEPLAAATALHAAARVAPTVTVGNRLRIRALSLYGSVGAERSIAAVLRERSMHRGAGAARLPVSQRNRVHPGLTLRERQVAELVRRGLTAQEISAELSLSVGTVRNHIARIRDKFGGVTKRQLAGLLGDGT